MKDFFNIKNTLLKLLQEHLTLISNSRHKTKQEYNQSYYCFCQELIDVLTELDELTLIYSQQVRQSDDQNNYSARDASSLLFDNCIQVRSIVEAFLRDTESTVNSDGDMYISAMIRSTDIAIRKINNIG